MRPRPTPYAGAYLALRIDDRHSARELLGRLLPALDSVATFDPEKQVSLLVGFSFQGLKALGVPEDSLASFPSEFRQGMAARAADLGDVEESAPENWEAPLGSGDVHLVLAPLAPDAERLNALLLLAHDALRELPGLVPIWQQEVSSAPDERNWFGFRDSIGQPTIEGTGILGTNPDESPLKAGEFVLGYEDETGSLPPIPQPDVLGRNGDRKSVV